MMKFTSPRQVKFAAGGMLGDRQVRAVISTPDPDRAGDVLVSEGCDLSQFKKNPICLANHQIEAPIGNVDATVRTGGVDALITFAPKGASKLADEFCALCKASPPVLRATSVGFNPIEYDPIRGGGYRYRRWELLEVSICSVPCNPNALIVERGLRGMTGTLSRSGTSSDEVEKCIKAMASCYLKASGSHDSVHEQLVQWQRHGTSAGDRAKALRHWVNSQPHAPPAMREHMDELDKALRMGSDCYKAATRSHDDLHDQLEEWQDVGTSLGRHARSLRDGGNA